MKAKVHPEWFPQAKAKCTCGNTFLVGSTKPELHVEICSACHPFWTGALKFVDRAGRVEKFEQKRKGASGKLSRREKAKIRLETKERERLEEEKRPKTFKEMLHSRSELQKTS